MRTQYKQKKKKEQIHTKRRKGVPGHYLDVSKMIVFSLIYIGIQYTHITYKFYNCIVKFFTPSHAQVKRCPLQINRIIILGILTTQRCTHRETANDKYYSS